MKNNTTINSLRLLIKEQESILKLTQKIIINTSAHDSIKEKLQNSIDIICESMSWNVGHICFHNDDFPKSSDIWYFNTKNNISKSEITLDLNYLLIKEDLNLQKPS